MASFAERLRELRISKGIGQKEVGAIINVSDSSIRKYESGVRTPNPEAIMKLANFFEVSTDDLLGTTPAKPSEDKKPKDLQKILDQHEIMFSGTPLTEEDKQAILDVVELQLYKRAKELNKRKRSKEE